MTIVNKHYSNIIINEWDRSQLEILCTHRMHCYLDLGLGSILTAGNKRYRT